MTLGANPFLQRHHASAEQIDAGAAIHGSLEGLQFVDLPFGLPVAPRLGDSVSNGLQVLAFDSVLALRLRWPRPLPLLATRILDPSIRREEGGRPRPGDPTWPNATASAIALAAASAIDLAADLARRAETLIAVAPKLRAKSAARIVALLLAQDCVAPAEAARQAPMTDRAARRLFDRLLALGAVRELSGRPAFRLYGL